LKETKYNEIADKYDNNKFRHDIKLDTDLKEFIEHSQKRRIAFFDLSCGTGIYLSKQIAYFNNTNIDWYALDASQEMLDKAKAKTNKASFKLGVAEQLPYDSEQFDFISNNYAFHHYKDKSKALDEVVRVAKKGAIYKMHNISIHDMKKWWIYEFFPSAYFEDLKRFWEKELILNELNMRNFDAKIRIEYRLEATKIADFINYVYNRDISVLTLISDDDYNSGLEMMEYKIKKNPDATVLNDFAEIFVIAAKK
jgi:ubiquinone/menaquinone biosynthesis C-methylase UbiE